MIVAGEDLARITYNGMQFVNPKSLRLPGQVLFVASEDSFRVYSCDDYIALSDSTILPEKNELPFQFVITLAATKELEKFARLNKKYHIQIEKNDKVVSFFMRAESENEADSFETELQPEYDENWDLVDALLFEDAPKTLIPEFYIRSERVANLSKLKTDKEAPIGFRAVDFNGHKLIRFRLGTSINGVLNPVNTSDIDPKYLWEDDA